MPEPRTRWLDSGLAGNERPLVPPVMVEGLDPGLAAVRYIYDCLRVDRRWSVVESRGFTRWPGAFAQRIWTDLGVDDEGTMTYRLHAETAVARAVDDIDSAMDSVNLLNGFATTSAFILETERSQVTSRASMWVQADTLTPMTRLFSAVAVLQASDAHIYAATIARFLGGLPAASAHPTSGPRLEPDDSVSRHEALQADGQQPSRWAGREQVQAREQLARSARAARGDESGMVMRLPFGDDDCLLRTSTTERHPDIGSGMLVRLTMPVGAVSRRDAVAANALNRQELRSSTRSHFLGSWIAKDDRLTHVAFLPNSARLNETDVLDLTISEVRRASWFARDVAGVTGDAVADP